MLSPRDNLLRLYRRQGHDRAPIELPLCPSLVDQWHRTHGAISPWEHFSAHSRSLWLSPRRPHPVEWAARYPFALKPGTTFDDWGVAHEPGSAAAFHMTRMRHPLAACTTIDELAAWPWADYATQLEVDGLATAVREAHAAGLPFTGLQACTVWEAAWYLRSMEALMADMADGDPKAVWLLDRLTDQAVIKAEAFARAGVDILQLGDDIGTQRGPLMSRTMYQRWLKPRLDRVIASAKRIRPDLLILYRSCGNVQAFIPDLIDAGVDILNPLQPECLDVPGIIGEYRGRLSFNGGLGTQSTMPHGTAQEVREATGRLLESAGDAGGFLVAPTHLLEPEVPWDNIIAYAETCCAWRPGAVRASAGRRG